MIIVRIPSEDICICRVVEDCLDESNALKIKAQLLGRVASGDYRLILDLSRVTSIDFCGFGVLFATLEALGQRGELMVAGLMPPVAAIFKSTRMERAFTIVNGESEAMAQLRCQDLKLAA